MKLAFIDLETDNLLDKVTTVHLAVAFMEDTGMYHIYHGTTDNQIDYPTDYVLHNSLGEWVSALSDYILVGHNIIQFDLMVLNKLIGYTYNLDNVLDTLVLSRLYYPDRDGHSLDWWGTELRFNKLEFKDFSAFSQEMLTYCRRDVDLTRRVYFWLQEQEKGWDWSESIRLTNRFYDIMARQEQYGVLFDVDKAEKLLDTIESELLEIEAKVLAEVPKKAVQVGATITKPFLKSGGYSKQVQEWIQTL